MAAAQKQPVTINCLGPLNGAASGLLTWVDQLFPLMENWRNHLAEYYAPKNFNFWYYFGSLAMFVLVLGLSFLGEGLESWLSGSGDASRAAR